MATSDLKKRVLEYVQEADEPLLQLMESLAQNYHKEALHESALTEDQWKLIDERWDAYPRGEGESYTWEEVKERARRAAK